MIYASLKSHSSIHVKTLPEKKLTFESSELGVIKVTGWCFQCDRITLVGACLAVPRRVWVAPSLMGCIHVAPSATIDRHHWVTIFASHWFNVSASQATTLHGPITSKVFDLENHLKKRQWNIFARSSREETAPVCWAVWHVMLGYFGRISNC